MTEASTAPYFAYSSNMCREVMAKIAPSAKVLDVGRLDGHRLAFTRRSVVWHAGVADIPEFQGFSVYGVLCTVVNPKLEEIPPHADYLRQIIDGAEQNKLPQPYLDFSAMCKNNLLPGAKTACFSRLPRTAVFPWASR